MKRNKPPDSSHQTSCVAQAFENQAKAPAPASDRENPRRRVSGRPVRREGTRFKPGQSGNPAGAKPKSKSMAPDLKAHLQEALNSKINLMQDNRERVVTKAAAGIEQVVTAFAGGDRHALRAVLDMARRLDLGTDSAAKSRPRAPSPQSPDRRRKPRPGGFSAPPRRSTGS